MHRRPEPRRVSPHELFRVLDGMLFRLQCSITVKLACFARGTSDLREEIGLLFLKREGDDTLLDGDNEQY